MFEQDQDVFNILLGAVSESVVIVDENQKIIEVNESAEQLFGYDNRELINKELNVLMPHNYHAAHGSHFKGFMKQDKKRQMGKGRDIYGVKKTVIYFL